MPCCQCIAGSWKKNSTPTLSGEVVESTSLMLHRISCVLSLVPHSNTSMSLIRCRNHYLKEPFSQEMQMGNYYRHLALCTCYYSALAFLKGLLEFILRPCLNACLVSVDDVSKETILLIRIVRAVLAVQTYTRGHCKIPLYVTPR